MNTWRKVGCCLVAAIAALGAWAEVKWSYMGTTLTQTDAPEGATPWAFTVNATTGALTAKTNGTGPVLDLRRETLPDGVPAFTGAFPKTYNDNGCTTCEEVYLEGFTSLSASCFRKWTGLRVISLPAGLTTIADTAFYSCSALTVIELPETVVSIGTEAFRYCSNLAHIEPGFAKLTSIGYGICRDCKVLADEIWIGYATNNDEMVETVFTGSDGYYSDGYYFVSSGVKDIHIGPGVMSIPNNFLVQTAFKSVEYGCNVSAFPATDVNTGPSMTNLVLRYTGDIELISYNLNQMRNLRELTWSGWFTVKAGANNPFNAWTALQCRFIVPGNNTKWLGFMADATKMTPWASCSAADKTTYFNRYGAAAKVPEGISVAVSGGLPRTYIVKTDVEVTDFPLTVNMTDDVTITRDPEPSDDGTYPKGTVVTVTAEPQGGARFVGWQGDLPPGCEHDQTIQVTMDGAKVLTVLVESRTFTYDSSAKTISDGVTTISVTESAGALTLGKISAHREDGVLDLSKPISGGKIITAIPASWRQYCSGWLTELKLPETLTSIGDEAFRWCSKLQKIEPCLPNALTYLGSSAFNDCSSLAGDIRFGVVTNAGEMVETKMGGGSQFKNTKLSGLVIGPGVTSLPSAFFSLASFRFVEFGCNVSTFSDDSSLTAATNLVFCHTGEFALPAGAFNQARDLREIMWHGWFTYPGNANVFNTWTALQCRFIVPRTNENWNVFMADPDRMTPWADCDQADKDAYFARYGADAVWPAGISVAEQNGLPRTYIVRTLEGANEAQLVAETSNGAMSSITLDPPPSPETGLYEADKQVTVTLTLKEGASLVGWEGDVAEADRTKTSFVVTMDKSKRVFAKVCVQPEIAVGSFAVAFPHGDSQAKVSFALTGVAGAVYDATAEILVKNGGEWSVWQTLTGLTNGQAVSTWVPTPLEPGSTAEFTVRVAAPNAAARTTGTPDPVDVPSTWPTTWGKGGGEGVCHVKADATGNGSGSDWFNAMTAIPLAEDDLPADRREIWVATNVVVGESAACTLRAPVSFRGGFVGLETSAEARPAGLKSVLDGEGTRETFTLTASGAAGAEYAFERLVFTRSLTRGLSFTAAANANPILTAVDCDFIANGADGTINGRGLYLKNGGDSSLSNCTFQGNVCRSCPNDSAGYGFGAYFEGNDNRVFIDNCQFLTNGYAGVGYATAFAAAFYANTKVVTARDCEFRGNRSSVYGDGSIVHIAYTQANGGSAFTNCVFAGNELCETHNNADNAGIFAMRLYNGQSTGKADLCNCTFAYNIGGEGYGCAGVFVDVGTVHAANCIFFDNVVKGTSKGADLTAKWSQGTINAEYCLFGGEGTNYVKSVDGGTLTLGEGIVYGNPKFVTPQSAFLAETEQVNENTLPQAGAGNGNPHFKEAFSPNLLAFDVHVRPGCRSKAIDAGDPAADWSNEPKPNGKRLNLGAYGNTPEAARSPGGLVLFVQ